MSFSTSAPAVGFDASQFALQSDVFEDSDFVKFDVDWSPMPAYDTVSDIRLPIGQLSLPDSQLNVQYGDECSSQNSTRDSEFQSIRKSNPENDSRADVPQGEYLASLHSYPSSCPDSSPEQSFHSTFNTRRADPSPASSHSSLPAPSRIQKRKLNTMAARRYRQKRVDQMNDLEATLQEVRAERDALKIKAARLEGEVDVLRSLLKRGH
jgi:hypothetical protein